MKTKRAVIVQCRLSSSRLPAKALKLLGEKPVLAWVLNAMKKVKADKYYVATDEASFSALEPICRKNGFECFAGELDDVLKRFCDLIKKIKVDTIIRATADNPFLFYEAAQASLDEFEEKKKGRHPVDYLTFTGLPHGSGVEIINAKALLKAAEETDNPYDHEHVGPALYNHKENYKCEFIKAPFRFYNPELRTTIDTFSDYLRALTIVNYLGQDTKPYTTEQIIDACKSDYVNNPVILVPSVSKGQGTGHLHRCLAAAVEAKFFVYIPKDSTLGGIDAIIDEYKEKGLHPSQIIDELPDNTYSPVIVTDCFSMSREQSVLFYNAKKLISIDEGSAFSDYCDYLLDIIPSYEAQRIANSFDTSYIKKPQNVRAERTLNIEKVLVCLGGEDPAGLTLPAAQALTRVLPGASITAVVANPEQYQNILNINFVPPIENLREKIYEYDLVVSHYGLTSFEALFAGCAVIMLATTKLHENLAQKYDFAFIPQGKIDAKKMQEALASEKLFPKPEQIENMKMDASQKSLGVCLSKLAAGQRLLCPVCRTKPAQPDIVVSRNEGRTYRRCRSCGLVYMSFTAEEDKEYKKAYFFEDYKKQYGKTYQEDFESIKKQCVRRLDIIKAISGEGISRNYLDIGCAYGPSLAAASELGFSPFGTDISEDAVHFVKNKLHYPSCCSAFPELDPEKEFGITKFDSISMWYVIEHFKDLKSVLEKVSQILRSGGVFAFSTPSGEGVSAKSNPGHFYKISPTDHYSIWEPSKAGKILKKFGFEVVKIVSTGHHPERFPSVIKDGVKPGSLRWKMVDKYSRLMELGDTVEIYCRKRF